MNMSLKNGTIIGVSGRSPFRPRDLNDKQLAQMNHAEWLEQFSQILAMQTPVEMTPKREGTITRLHWASTYVIVLERLVKKLELELQELKKQRSSASPEGS